MPKTPNDQIRSLGQYPTPVWVAEDLVERHFHDLDSGDMVIEPSCGPGAFLSALPDGVPAIGVEIDAAVAEQARENTGRRVVVGDFRTVGLDVQPTAIIGNPPFNLEVIDGFLARAHQMLPEGGRVGFLLPAYAFQTAARVAGYADHWSLMQEMIPRNIFPGLKLPLVFALFSKDRRRGGRVLAVCRNRGAPAHADTILAREGAANAAAVRRSVPCRGAGPLCTSWYRSSKHDQTGATGVYCVDRACGSPIVPTL